LIGKPVNKPVPSNSVQETASDQSTSTSAQLTTSSGLNPVEKTSVSTIVNNEGLIFNKDDDMNVMEDLLVRINNKSPNEGLVFKEDDMKRLEDLHVRIDNKSPNEELFNEDDMKVLNDSRNTLLLNLVEYDYNNFHLFKRYRRYVHVVNGYEIK
jgi:hypothetical protein